MRATFVQAQSSRDLQSAIIVHPAQEGARLFLPITPAVLLGIQPTRRPAQQGVRYRVCVLTLYLYVSSLKGQKTRTATATKRCRGTQAGAFPPASPCPRLGTLALAGRVAG
jgi:hypothetical protein